LKKGSFLKRNDPFLMPLFVEKGGLASQVLGYLKAVFLFAFVVSAGFACPPLKGGTTHPVILRGTQRSGVQAQNPSKPFTFLQL
jgi:hypothetical protein